MSTRISKNFLIVFGILLLLSGFLLSTPGYYWPWYSIMAGVAVVPVVVGPFRYRLLGTLAVILSVVLIVSDLVAGQRLRERRKVVPSTQFNQSVEPSADNALSFANKSLGSRELLVGAGSRKSLALVTRDVEEAAHATE